MCFSILASQLNSDLLKSDPDLSNDKGAESITGDRVFQVQVGLVVETIPGIFIKYIT